MKEVGAILSQNFERQKLFKILLKSLSRFVPKYIFIDNGNEWMKEFDAMCQVYDIIHQHGHNAMA
jgi:hypothetical protein